MTDLSRVAADLPRALCFGRVRNSSVFIDTGVTYPNGVSATVRIDADHSNFVVSDDGYAQEIARSMGATSVFSRIAASLAERSGVSFRQGTFFVDAIGRDVLPSAVSLIANTSARAIERVGSALEQPRLKRSREAFDKKLEAAFGNQAVFDVQFRGATGRDWLFSAGVEHKGTIVRLFELVSPTTQAVALANMKFSDTQALPDPPGLTAALVDYDGTDPALRSILSNVGSLVIPAASEVATYRLQ